MTILNDAMQMIDLPHVFQEVAYFGLSNNVTGSCTEDDGERYIYHLISAVSFGRYDTWYNTYQPLPNPVGTFGAGTCMRYTKMIGAQINKIQYGTIYLLMTNGVNAATFQKFDCGTGVWSTLNVVGLTATFGTEGNLLFPTPAINAFDHIGYHGSVLKTITTTNVSANGATSISIIALTAEIPVGAKLNFGTNASPLWAALTSPATIGATVLTVAPLVFSIPSASTAQWYDFMYLIGNASTVMYRFTLSTAVWSTTSANAGTPAIASIPGAVGSGCTMRWIPGIEGYENKFVLVRGANTNSIYIYDLISNSWSTLSYTPNTELFYTGTMSCVVPNLTTGKPDRMLIAPHTFQNLNVRILELDILNGRMDAVSTLSIYPTGVAVAGEKLQCITSPNGVNILYCSLHTSTVLLRDLSISLI